MTNKSLKIIEPILESDFDAAQTLIEENLFRFSGMMAELKRSSNGEILLTKSGDEIVGMLQMRRPGKIFKEIEDKYFDPKNLGNKDDTGYIALVIVSKKYQGQGIGKKLVEKAIKLQKDWEAQKIIVHASKSSPGNASEKLFAKMGFESGSLHKAPWLEYSKKQGAENFYCNFCGNPCHCDELEMVKYL